MKDAELKRNASGYYDETAYKAITAPPKAGEVWVSQDGRKTWLILQNHGTVCSTLLMGTEERENSIKVMARVPMYTDPTMVGYTFTDYVSTFVKTIPGTNMDEVRLAVGKALGITDINPPYPMVNGHINALEDKVLKLTKERDEAQKKADDLSTDLYAKSMAEKMVSDSIADMEQEICTLRVYKDMYMDLIEKLVSVKVGAVND